jgi:hypothetical protein
MTDMNLPFRGLSLTVLFFAGFVASTPAVAAQQLPDSPGSSSSFAPVTDTSSAGPLTLAQAQASEVNTQPFRFRGIISTRGLVQEGSTQPPQTVHDKFVIATEDNFNLYGIAAVSAVAGYDLALNRTPEFGSGGKGYARYYWHSYTDRVVEIYSVELLAPVIFHQDTRFYYLGQGPVAHRIAHSIRRTFVTRSDSGKEEFNYSEIFGAGAASGISTLYYPSRERTVTNTLANWGINLGVDALAFVGQELYPSVFQAVFHRRIDPPESSNR